MQEDIFTLLLIIWSQALAYCFRFWQVGIVIIMILRASVLSNDEKPANNFYTKFYSLFFFRNVRILGVLVFYRVANLPIEKVCIIKNFEEANFRDSERLVLSWKITPQKYNWPQKTCKLLKNTFAGSNWSVIVMRIEQSEVYDTV